MPLVVEGYTQFVIAVNHADTLTKKKVHDTFQEVGDIVRDDARQRFRVVDARTADGFRTRVRQRGVSVEQSLRKTTGKRPDYGALQMREALLPALHHTENQVEQAFDRAMDVVADYFDRL